MQNMGIEQMYSSKACVVECFRTIQRLQRAKEHLPQEINSEQYVKMQVEEIAKLPETLRQARDLPVFTVWEIHDLSEKAVEALGKYEELGTKNDLEEIFWTNEGWQNPFESIITQL